MAAANEMVGEYRLFYLIRAGATFEIWAVRHRSETEAYAIKFLKKGSKYSRTTVAELKHEFNVGKALDHPSVIETHDFGVAKEGAWLRMELFKELSIKQQLVACKQTPALKTKLTYRMKEILTKCAAGIAHMHEKGWVHRDIKPDNFLLSDATDVRLIDFTIAAKPTGGLGKLLGGKTKIQGTYSYMSPDQIRGNGVDPRDDVYSFGCMVHELMCGALPFTANSPNELMQKHIKSRPPSLVVADKNINPDFAAYVQRMLAKDRKERPESMKEVMMKIKADRIFYQTPDPPAEGAEDAAPEEDEG
ncbi:serine/threonine-protein kinase [Posidoniimonas polymericola]|nr:serine/threonine-protein kinase [Posidoniimonas polymericola]